MTISKIINNELWIPILNNIGIDKKYYDKMFTYLNNHANCEHIEHILSSNKILDNFSSTVVVALRVLSKLDLSKVEILTSPTENCTPCSSIVENIHVDGLDELTNTGIDVEAYLYQHFAETTTDTINKFIEKEGSVKIYCLYLEIKNEGNKFRILHRLM